MAYGRSVWDDVRYELSSGNIIFQLIFINVLVFFAINLVNVAGFLAEDGSLGSSRWFLKVKELISLPADVKLLIKRPWTLITHMFAHYRIFHILFNMLWLYWFGKIVVEFIGNKKILPLYILGGLSGAALLILSYNIFPGLKANMPLVQALGASAGVLAIIVAAATIVPNYTVFLLLLGPVKIKWIAVVLVVIDLISIPEQNSGGHIAHLGGALFGFIYIRQLQAGTDLASPFIAVYERVVMLFGGKSTPKSKPMQRATVPPGSRKQKKVQEENPDKQARIDAILDKISRSGYDSLSKEEKEFLFKVSKED